MNKRKRILIVFALFVAYNWTLRSEHNDNTLLATCCILQQTGLISNHNGIGSTITGKTVELVREKEKKEFIANELPELRRKVALLQLNEQDLSELLDLIKSNSK